MRPDQYIVGAGGGLRGALMWIYAVALVPAVYMGGACVVMPALMVVLAVLYGLRYLEGKA